MENNSLASQTLENPTPNRLAGMIQKHELAGFFTATLLISWTVWGILAQIPLKNPTTVSRIILIGAYAPSLSALLLSSVKSSKRNTIAPGRFWAVFIPVLILVAGIEWLDHIWWNHKIDLSLVAADVILVFLAAFTMTWFCAQRVSDRPKFKCFAQLPSQWIWVIVALGGWPLLVLIGNTIARLFGLHLSSDTASPDIHLLALLPETFLWALFFGGPLNEEPGWRGFALPRLQARFSPLVASLILGAVWGLWHVPQHLLGWYPGGPLGFVIRIEEIPRAILFTWLYNRTKGNLWIVLMFHAAINTSGYLMTRSYEIVFALLFIIVIPIIIVEKMWQKPKDSLEMPPGRYHYKKHWEISR